MAPAARCATRGVVARRAAPTAAPIARADRLDAPTAGPCGAHARAPIAWPWRRGPATLACQRLAPPLHPLALHSRCLPRRSIAGVMPRCDCPVPRPRGLAGRKGWAASTWAAAGATTRTHATSDDAQPNAARSWIPPAASAARLCNGRGNGQVDACGPSTLSRRGYGGITTGLRVRRAAGIRPGSSPARGPGSRAAAGSAPSP